METFSAITINRYLKLLEEDALSAPNLKEISGALFLKLEEVLKEYKSLDCSSCGSHFGYQHRRHPNIKLCNSSRCLAIVKEKPQSLGGVGLDISDSPNPDTSVSGLTTAECEPTDLQKEVIRCDKLLETGLEKAATSSTVSAEARTEANLMTKPEAGISQSPKMVPVAVILKAVKSQDNKNEKKIWNLDDVSLSPALVHHAPCVVSFSWGQHKITINAESDLPQMEKLQSETADYVNEDGAKPLNLDGDSLPSVNEIVLTPYDRTIYRGRVVKEISSKGNVLLQFIDFEDFELVKVEECCEPSEKITEHLMYGLTFTLRTLSTFPQDLKYKAELHKIIEDKKFYLQTDGQEPCKLERVGSLLLDEEVKGKTILNAMLDQFILKNSLPAAKSPEPVALDLLPKVKGDPAHSSV